MPRAKKQTGIDWHQQIDFATVVLAIIIFGSTAAYIMVYTIK